MDLEHQQQVVVIGILLGILFLIYFVGLDLLFQAFINTFTVILLCMLENGRKY
jgi:hypothetical protein